MKARDLMVVRLRGLVWGLLVKESTATINVGGTYVQLAGCPGRRLFVEVASNRYLPDDSQLSATDEARLFELGFSPPDDDLPNWWIGVADDDHDSRMAALAALVAALLDVYRVDPVRLARRLGLTVEPFRPRTPPNFAPPAGDEEYLGERLALLEPLWLRAIKTGELPFHDDWAKIRAFEAKHLAAPSAAHDGHPREAGWEGLERLRAAEDVVYCLSMFLGAEYVDWRGDIHALMLALQAWVHTSPWADEYDFVVLGDPNDDGDCWAIQRITSADRPAAP